MGSHHAVNDERYIAPDGLPDDRVTCQACTSLDHRGWCAFFKAKTMPELPRRCVHFIPLRSVPDQRTGAQRWPGILEQIAEISAIDRTWNERR